MNQKERIKELKDKVKIKKQKSLDDKEEQELQEELESDTIKGKAKKWLGGLLE